MIGQQLRQFGQFFGPSHKGRGGQWQGLRGDVGDGGKPVVITAINIHRVVGGQIQEGWLNWDALGLLQQLGVVPANG